MKKLVGRYIQAIKGEYAMSGTFTKAIEQIHAKLL